MKKSLFFLLFGIALSGCLGQSGSSRAVEDITVKDDSVVLEKPKTQAEYIQEWKDQGVDNFSFDKKGYLVYKVKRSDVSADPDWVAKQHFDMAYVEGIKGCIVVDENGKEFGRYEP